MVAVAKHLRSRPANDANANFLADVVAGLSANRKYLLAKYFYDERGSQLFEAITELDEYYPTRCEMEILRTCAADMAKLIPPGAAVVEFGSGSNKKARILLDAAPPLAAYVPVDISPEMLFQEADDLRRDCPDLDVRPVVADITRPFALPKEATAAPMRVGFFPGSTIGNFEPREAAGFFQNAAAILGDGAVMIVGADLVKSEVVLNAAYNDAAGVTAQFNLNLLARINRELGGDFDLDAFGHRAFFNRAQSRIEMHLVSRKRQSVKVGGASFAFSVGEIIHSENSYKYSIESLGDLARTAGWRSAAVWTDSRGYFLVQAFRLSG